MYGYIKYRLSTFMVTLHGTFLQHISSTWIQTGVQFSGTAKTSFADLHQVGDADSDAEPPLHFDADQDPDLFTLIWIRILLLIKVMRICDQWHTGPPPLHFEPLRLHCELPRCSMAPFEF
jgi:hypothetical protein